MAESDLPKRLSSTIDHPDYHPSWQRISVLIDGKDRNDITWYDVEHGLYRTVGLHRNDGPLLANSVQPYWRYPETRQQRRARERWEGRNG